MEKIVYNDIYNITQSTEKKRETIFALYVQTHRYQLFNNQHLFSTVLRSAS